MRTAVLVLLVLSLPALAQNHLTIHPALQGYKLLEPPGISHPVVSSYAGNPDRPVETLEVTNYGSQPVTKVEYGWRVAASAHCVGNTFQSRWGRATVKVNIPAGESASIAAPEFLSKDGAAVALLKESYSTKALALVVTLGVVKATYADGTVWEDKDVGMKNMFDSAMPEITEPCTAARASQ